MFRQLKKLEHSIAMTAVNPHMGNEGWEFGQELDVVNHKQKLYEIYLLTAPSYSGRATTPILWDKNLKPLLVMNLRKLLACLTRNLMK
ncbi:MAG: hypothetical protein AAF770_01110 [Bacteroidota bacterium]